ncbi:MAG: hypothetical protein HY860_03985 [Chlamydiales bacterium]|nr:hypothetical protein [Chlamydiales bacterium]
MRKLHYSYIIWSIVFTFHLAAFFVPSYFIKPPKKEQKHKIIVRSIKESFIVPAIEQPAPTNKVKEVKPPPTQKQKTPKTPTVKKNVEEPAIKTPKNAKQLKAKQLLSKLDKNLKQLQQKELPKNNVQLPKPLQLSSIEPSNDHTQPEIDCGELFSYFQNNLQLPEKGEIKVSITVQPNGKIANIQIIHTKSIQNANYLKEELPKLYLPKLADEPIALTVIFREET